MEKEQLRAMRLFEKKSIRAFAESIGVSHSTIFDAESGRRSVSPSLRGKVAAVYELSPAFLAFYDNYLRMSKAVPSPK